MRLLLAAALVFVPTLLLLLVVSSSVQNLREIGWHVALVVPVGFVVFMVVASNWEWLRDEWENLRVWWVSRREAL